MPETRQAQQYKIYTLHANVEVVLGKRDGEDIKRTDRVPVAIFTEKELCDTYQAEEQSKLKGQTGYEVVEDWVEFEPTADRFSLPLNPVPNAPETVAEGNNDTNSNGNN